ncbi:sensor histidine kinase KdpD, partial [Dysgonomonas sp. OttesenSCG-928-M03]|nr:sensor histidine kinase KdpD [Dysgonomonas sp. OttesenSCG-928-M03]
SSEFTFYPLRGTRTKPGVVGIKLTEHFSGETELFWETFLTQIANTIEHHQFAGLAKESNLADESEKLYRILFNKVIREMKISVESIVEASGILRNNLPKDDLYYRLYDNIIVASNHLDRLTQNLLNLSSLETGNMVMHTTWVNMKDVFESVAKYLEETLKRYHLDIVVPAAMPLVKIDSELMEQILCNLVSNSCKYSKPGATIRLKAFYDDGSLIVQEMDRGRGLDPNALSFVSNKFYKARYGDENQSGLGLGLSVVKGLVESLNGTILVENRQHGGVRFTIKIPVDITYS